MAFEFLDHTADLKFRAVGGSFEEALAEAAKALTYAIAGDSEINPAIEREFEIKIHKPQILVHDFLQELIYLFSTEELLFSEFELVLKESLGYKLTAKLGGEKYDPKRHHLEREVKAATYHDLVAEERDGKWVVEVICDS
jgi:SHS2 domain-containing protein